MKRIGNERGIALITAILLSFVALVVILALMYIVSQGTQVSAANKRYRSALEATYGGAEVFTKDLLPQLLKDINAAPTPLTDIIISNGGAAQLGNSTCVGDKLTKIPGQWQCNADATLEDPKKTPDATFQLRGQAGQPDFNLYAKIIDTQPGNSDASAIDYLFSGSGVAYSNQGMSPQHIPAVYRIEVQGERATDPQEKAKLSVLYAY